MASNSTNNDRPRLIPRLAYQDADAAIGFLSDAFGLSETARFAPAGQIIHAELAMNGETIIAVSSISHGVQSPKTLGGNTTHLFCYVDDVDSHCEQARNAGAQVLDEPTDQPWGERSYDVLDIEGYLWTFRKHVEHVSLDELATKLGYNCEQS